MFLESVISPVLALIYVVGLRYNNASNNNFKMFKFLIKPMINRSGSSCFGSLFNDQITMSPNVNDNSNYVHYQPHLITIVQFWHQQSFCWHHNYKYSILISYHILNTVWTFDSRFWICHSRSTHVFRIIVTTIWTSSRLFFHAKILNLSNYLTGCNYTFNFK